MKCRIFILLLSFFCIGCVYRAKYNIALKDVKGIPELNLTIKDASFEDENIKITWVTVMSKHIAFSVKNKQESPIRILWDNASFVDVLGTSHRVIHSGVRLLDRDKSQPPSTIVGKASFIDHIVPSDNIALVSGYWKTYAIFPDASDGISNKEFKTDVESYTGKTFQVLLPFQIKDTTKEYLFSFKIENTTIKKDTFGDCLMSCIFPYSQAYSQ